MLCNAACMFHTAPTLPKSWLCPLQGAALPSSLGNQPAGGAAAAAAGAGQSAAAGEQDASISTAHTRWLRSMRLCLSGGTDAAQYATKLCLASMLPARGIRTWYQWLCRSHLPHLLGRPLALLSAACTLPWEKQSWPHSERMLVPAAVAVHARRRLLLLPQGPSAACALPASGRCCSCPASTWCAALCALSCCRCRAAAQRAEQACSRLFKCSLPDRLLSSASLSSCPLPPVPQAAALALLFTSWPRMLLCSIQCAPLTCCNNALTKRMRAEVDVDEKRVAVEKKGG